MMKFYKSKLLNKNIPSEISKFFTDELTNYLVIKDGHILVSNLESEFSKLTINNISDKLEIFNDEKYQVNLDSINSGVFIEAPKNFVANEILQIFYIQENIDLVNNTVIILNENSELNYFEYLINMNETNINFVSNSIVKENAKLTYSGISNYNDLATINVTRNSYVSRYGSSSYSIAEVNDSLVESNTNIFLEGSYASATAKTIAITANNQSVKIKQLLEHNAPDTEGYIENYGVSNNQSSLVFEAVGKINKNMKRSVARQQNKGIVLGENARLDANPLLLIDEYDVEAGHGAAIGKIDEEQLYYLMSRGLTLKNAERLIISGFLSPVTKLLSTEELIEDFIGIVERKTL